MSEPNPPRPVKWCPSCMDATPHVWDAERQRWVCILAHLHTVRVVYDGGVKYQQGEEKKDEIDV